MKQPWFWVPVVCLCLASGLCLADVKESKAMTVLQAADQAIRQLETLSYSIEYDGLHWARGRVSAEVKLQRSDGQDKDLGTIKFELRADVRLLDAPSGNENYPERFTLLTNSRDTWVVDSKQQHVEHADGFDRIALIAVTNVILLPQYTRIDPFALEMNDSIAARHLGTSNVGGTQCHTIWLKFPDDSGYGEQLLYIGIADLLIRKAIVVTPMSAAGPHGMMQMALNDVRREPVLSADTFRFTDMPGYRRMEFQGRDAELGTMGPNWAVSRMGGGYLRSQDLRGQVAVIVFWSSWCPTCHAFFPELQNLRDHYDADQVRIVALNVFDRDDPQPFMKENEYTFEVGLNANAAIHQFRFVGAPSVVVIDPAGRIHYRQLGAAPASTGNPGIWAAVEEALKKVSE